jgi:hypothetical protein
MEIIDGRWECPVGTKYARPSFRQMIVNENGAESDRYIIRNKGT